MFGIFKKNNDEVTSYYKEYERLDKLDKALWDKQKPYWEWLESEEGNRIYHLQNLIIKTYETVNINAVLSGRRINESFTREDYIKDYSIFFRPEVFNKLKAWCGEYVALCKVEEKLISGE